MSLRQPLRPDIPGADRIGQATGRALAGALDAKGALVHRPLPSEFRLATTECCLPTCRGQQLAGFRSGLRLLYCRQCSRGMSR